MKIRFKTQSNMLTAIILSKNYAFKIFYGKNFYKRLRIELKGQEKALKCKVWRYNVLPKNQINNLPIIYGEKGNQIDLVDENHIYDLIDDVISKYKSENKKVELNKFIDIGILRMLAGEDIYSEISDKFLNRFKDIKTYSGPQHGDLHKGNLVFHEEKIKVIDFDRFKSNGLPILDKLHFDLSERQNKTRGKWLDVLFDNPELCTRVYNNSLINSIKPEDIFILYALDRIINEGKATLYRKGLVNKYRYQLEKLLNWNGDI